MLLILLFSLNRSLSSTNCLKPAEKDKLKPKVIKLQKHQKSLTIEILSFGGVPSLRKT